MSDASPLNWTPSTGTTHWNLVCCNAAHKNVRDPTAPSTTNFVSTTSANTTDKYNLTAPNQAATSLTVHLYGKKTGTTAESKCQVIVNGVGTGLTNNGLTASAGWVEITFSGSWTAADLASSVLEIQTETMSGGPEVWVYAAYVGLNGN